MNRAVLLGTLCTGLVLGANCSQTGPSTTIQSSGGSSGGSTTSAGGSSGTGGAQSLGGSSALNSGGAIGNGGASDSGGEIGKGGASASGGATGNGGSSGLGGGSAAGGKTGSGGSGAGGSTANGGTTGSNGGAQDTGGAQSAGGIQGTGGAIVSGGTTGSGGVNGTGGEQGTGGASGALNPKDIVPDLVGFYWEGTCSGNISATGKTCPFAPAGSTSATCPSGSTWATSGSIRDTNLAVKGTTGTQYTITFDVHGVAGTRCYTGGTPASTTAPSATGPNNTWYVGGQQANDSIWNTYELHVSPTVTGEANTYFLNAFPSNPDWCQKEASYEIKYTASFKVLGGGTMKFTIHDTNCLAQQNCGGNDTDTTCNSPRTIDLSGMNPAATFAQPPTNTVGGTKYYPQWLYFDVKSVTSP